MPTHIPIYCGEDAVAEMIDYCRSTQRDRFFVIADQNTYPALGERVEAALEDQGWGVKTIRLEGEHIIANEEYLIQVLLQTGDEARTYVAVGSGTITDIVRFCSHRSRNAFISLPTAPSVDGFTSIGAPLVVRNIKQTAIAQPPAAVFADLKTLCQAPHDMIAAGFGDILGKYTSLADWKLGHVLWDEPYSAAIAQRMRRALKAVLEDTASIGRASPDGVRQLIEALLESGLCMLDFGETRPASGTEHHISHFWEMKLLQERRPAVLHGAKVGLGTIMAAQRYDTLRGLEPDAVVDARLPGREKEIAATRAAYGPLAESFIHMQQPFLAMTEAEFESLKRRAVERWEEVQQIAATVPPAREIEALLQQVGGPTDPAQLGFSEAEITQARKHAHYARARFTVGKFGHLMGWW